MASIWYPTSGAIGHDNDSDDVGVGFSVYRYPETQGKGCIDKQRYNNHLSTNSAAVGFQLPLWRVVYTCGTSVQTHEIADLARIIAAGLRPPQGVAAPTHTIGSPATAPIRSARPVASLATQPPLRLLH
jgi:hypothetical protein